MTNSANPPPLTAAEYYKRLNMRQLMEYAGASSRNTVWDYVEKGLLPKPSYPKPHRPTWLLGEVLEYTHRWTAFDAAPRGFRGSETVQAARAQEASPNVADRWEERFGFSGKKSRDREKS